MSKEELPEIGVTKLILSNGATVYYKKTDFKDNEILMRAFSMGGSSVIPKEQYMKTAYAMGAVEEAGMGGFSQNDLMKMMAGKEVSVNCFVGDYYEGIQGQSTIEDMETLFQMVYLKMTAMNKDDEAYQSYVQKQTAMMNNILNMPQYWYMFERMKLLEKNNPRFMNPIPSAEDFANQDYGLAYQLFKQRFANAADFTFFFVGSIAEAKLDELVMNYIASLPSAGEKESIVPNDYEKLKGDQTFEFKKGTDPKSNVDIQYATEAEYIPADAYYLRSAGEVLTIKLIENLREGQSGVYGVGARGSASKFPKGNYSLTISFPCGPENAGTLRAAAVVELNKIKENGPDQKDVDKVKEAQRLELKENLKKNNYWISNLATMAMYGMPLETITGYNKRIENLTAKDIQNVLNKYVKDDVITTMLMPED